VLFIIAPRAHVLSSISVCVGTISICFIVYPLAFIYITVCMVQFSYSIRLTISPLTLVAAAVEPFLLALTVAHTVEPLTLIYCSAIEVHRLAKFTYVFFEIRSLQMNLVAAEVALLVVVIVRAHCRPIIQVSNHSLAYISVKLVRLQSLGHSFGVNSAHSILRWFAFPCTVGEKT
jgi:hypothetical protein